jgi:uncharacterized protein (TIGR02145 family)
MIFIIFSLSFATSYSQDWSYKVYGEGNQGTFLDERDGQEYDWVKIGKQYWMAQNLNVGKIISVINNKITDVSVERFCFDDSRENCARYGGLYSNSVMKEYTQGEKSKSICPEGWHLPSASEWMILINGNGGMETAGDALKKSGIRKWSGTSPELADSVGFNALACGLAIYNNYTFDPEGLIIAEFQIAYTEEDRTCFFWTSTESGSLLLPRNKYQAFGFTWKKPKVMIYKGTALGAFSVRCVR